MTQNLEDTHSIAAVLAAAEKSNHLDEFFVKHRRESDDVESDDSEEEQQQIENSSKRQKLLENEKLHIRRERNREYSRCTRERKKAQIDLLQLRIEELVNEKARLELLIFGRSSHGTDPFSRQRYLASIMEKIKDEISYQLSDDEEAASIGDTVCKDRSMCSAEELEKIRRERNRVHAKKTRLKKRKMCIEMEQIIHDLENAVRRLRALRDGSPLESYHTFSGLPQIGKFTGFRHTNNVSSDAGSKQGGDDDQEVNSTQVSVPVIGACCSSGGDSIYSRSTDDCGESSSSDLSNTHAASIAAAAAHAAALTSAAAAAVPLINIPHEFKNVPGIQEVVLDYEKKLLMEMQKILLSHYFKAIAENMNMNH